MKTFKVRRKLNNTFEFFKGYYDGRPRVVYPEKFSVMAKGERKAFNTTKMQQTKPTEGNIHVEEQLSTAKRLWKEIKNEAIMVKRLCTTENTHKNRNRMAVINKHISIITLNTNDLNSLIIRYRITVSIKK